MPADSPLHGLIQQVRKGNSQVSEHELAIESPRLGRHFLSVQATPLPDSPGNIVLMMLDRGITEMIDRQMTHRGAARSITSMAAVLAHEVRNPLSGIRGAAQLLEQNASEDDRPLAELIRQEADRISTLIGRMEIFTDYGPFERHPVNIHKVLDRVQRLAETGFGANIRFRADFDPSLPPVPGDHDQLVQIFLNLVKNACDACPEVGGEINLRTAYQHGVRFTLSGRKEKVALPMKVSIIDNGPGIPEDLTSNLFDPFVTSKPNGTGLGLALVAKLVGDHGGVVECESRPGRTEFRVMLPFYEGGELGEPV
ncbi:MAG: two-component sensor histidine kinase [Rhodospirillaceae bacterium]|nr:two-component sensor histidine kinase [Rhodospirillaceae bacterium]